MRGFTLLELMIALVVLGVLGLGSAGLVFQVTNARDRVNAELWAADRLRWFHDRLAQDLATHSPLRPVRADAGNTLPALQLSENVLALTRLGWPVPGFSDTRRSELQRVSYRLAPWPSDICLPIRRTFPGTMSDNGEEQASCLVREYHTHLEPLPTAEPLRQAVLGPLTEATFRLTGQYRGRFSAGSNGWVETWPQERAMPEAEQMADPGAAALSLTLAGPSLPRVELLWRLPEAPVAGEGEGES